MQLPNHPIRQATSILVTGGTGFLGSYLLRYLLAYGYTDISALCRPDSRFDLLGEDKNRIKWIETDILDIQDLLQATEGVDRVFHCAAYISFKASERKKMIRANQEGTANVVNACLESGVGKLIHASSIAAIGRGKREKMVYETTKWENNRLNSDYSISKFLSEQEVWRGQAEGLETAIVNPSLILGSGYWDGFNTQRIFRLAWRSFPWYATGGTGIVDVRDVARMMIFLGESPISGERFICNSANWSFYRLSSRIAAELGTNPPRFKFGPLLRMVAPPLARLQSLFTGQTPSITRQTARMTSKIYEYSNDKSIRELNWTYIPPEKTIQETAAQLKQAGKEGWAPKVLDLY